MSQATFYYLNEVSKGAAYNKLMARTLETSGLRYDVDRLSKRRELEDHDPYYEETG